MAFRSTLIEPSTAETQAAYSPGKTIAGSAGEAAAAAAVVVVVVAGEAEGQVTSSTGFGS